MEVTKPSKTYSPRKSDKSLSTIKKNQPSINHTDIVINRTKLGLERPIVNRLRHTRLKITSIIKSFFRDIDHSFSYMKAFSEIKKLEKQGLPLSVEGEEVKFLGNGILAMKNWLGE